MLTESEIKEIREHLERAQNPIFFFDNDVDGLASFLILARYSGKGKGIAIKSGPDLNSSYLKKVDELNPDYIFVLDQPLVSSDFIGEIKKRNLPMVWIDHHDVDPGNIEGIYYYNSARSKRENEPVTYICWKTSRRKEDLWLAVCGCISDNFFPDFSKEFSKEFPEMLQTGIKTGFEALYESEIGKVARIMNFSLKDRTSSVIRMIKFLLKVKSPQEVINEEHIFLRFKQINEKYEKLMLKAEKFVKDSIVYFQYAGDLSISADIANELSYKFPGRLIVVVYISGVKANISIRGKKAREITLKAIDGFQDATGGGHEFATGAKISSDDLPEFKKRIEELVR